MASFEICEGAPGQGKSLYTAKRTVKLFNRNKKWFERTGKRRVIWSNIKFSESTGERKLRALCRRLGL